MEKEFDQNLPHETTRRWINEYKECTYNKWREYKIIGN